MHAEGVQSPVLVIDARDEMGRAHLCAVLSVRGKALLGAVPGFRHLAAHLPDVVLQLSAHPIEGISDRHIHVLIDMVFGGFPVHDQFPPRDQQVDADLEEVAVPVTAV
jgi:hypothetical protein